MQKLQSRIAAALLAASMLFGLAGCSESESMASSTDSAPDSSITETISSEENKPEPTQEPTEAPTSAPAALGEITLADIPAYTGDAFVAINDNVPLFSDEELTTDSFEDYSPLDSLGRCGVAYSCVGTETMPTEKRGSIGQVKPSGWHTVKYDFVDGKYLYNRCHLIGYQLTAENANERNLITGTRYLNIEGMLPFENMTADYIKETGNHVLYRVTPMFEGDDLVAKGVLMEGKSVEDNGDGVLFCVFAYNVQPGVTIDYATGDSYEDGTDTSAVPEQTPEPEATPEAVADSSEEETHTYILNTNSKKFHNPSCSSVKNMKDSNKQEYTGTRDALIEEGYEPCGKCNP